MLPYDNSNSMFTHHVFNVNKKQIAELQHPDTNIKKYVDDIIFANLNLQYSFHQRTNNIKYKSNQFQYATLFICLKKDTINIDGVCGNCAIVIDDTVIVKKKSMVKIKILVTPQHFKTNKIILVGNQIDNRAHLLNIDMIRKYETCNILLCKKDSNINFDEKIAVDVNFETFGTILNILNGIVKITDVSNDILNEMDKLGLVKPEYMLMKKFVDKKTSDILLQLNCFTNSDELMIFAPSDEMYANFKNIFSLSKNIVPIQMICVNHKKPNVDYMVGINIYDSIPIYYLETARADKPADKMIEEEINKETFDISTWIDGKKCDDPRDVNEIITKMLLCDYYGTFKHYTNRKIEKCGPQASFVSDKIYSDKHDAFVGQYILNYINCLKMENDIYIPEGFKRKLKNFLNIRIVDYDVCYLSNIIRKLLINNVEFKYHYCSEVNNCYYHLNILKMCH